MFQKDVASFLFETAATVYREPGVEFERKEPVRVLLTYMYDEISKRCRPPGCLGDFNCKPLSRADVIG